MLYGAYETGRPSCREQLLWIGAVAGSARKRELHIKPTIGGTRRASVPSASGVRLGGLKQLRRLSGGGFLGHFDRIHSRIYLVLLFRGFQF
jgi:hypothetical protein